MTNFCHSSHRYARTNAEAHAWVSASSGAELVRLIIKASHFEQAVALGDELLTRKRSFQNRAASLSLT